MDCSAVMPCALWMDSGEHCKNADGLDVECYSMWAVSAWQQGQSYI